MPYYKKSYAKGSKYATYTKTKRPLYGRLDKKAFSMAKKALSLINVEFKQINNQANETAVSSTHSLSLLNGIGTGDSDTARDGDHLRIKSIQMAFVIKQNQSANQTTVRLMLIRNRQTNYSTPTAGQMFSDITLNDAIVSPILNDNKQRFQIMWQRVVSLSHSGNRTKYIKLYKKLDEKVQYSGSGSGVAQISDKSYWLVMVSDEATNTPTVTFHSRIKFIDN